MSIMFEHKHVLLLPDGTKQELEWPPRVQEGDLVSSEALGITPEPDGKYIVAKVEELREQDGAPYILMYHLERY